VAAKQFIGGTGAGEWNTNANWAGGAFAINGDTVTFAATANPLKVNVASACTSIDFTGFTGTTNMAATLTVAGNVTLVAGMGVISGASALIVSTTSTLKSNAKTWVPPLTLLAGAVTYTLADAWTVTGNLTISLSTTVNGFSFTTGGNLSAPNSLSGTTTYTMNGTGTLSASTGIPNLTINTAGTITLSGIISIKTSLTITACGTLTQGTSTVGFITAAFTFTDSVGVVFYNVTTLVATVTVTLASNLKCSNNFAGGLTSTWNGAYTIYCVNYTYGANGIAGTATVEMNGGGALNLAGTLSGTGNNTMNLVFNSGANNITCNTTIGRNGGTVTYTSGTMVMTSSTLSLTGSTTLNTNGMSWNNITVQTTGGTTYTLNSLLTATGTYTSTISHTWAGSYGWLFTNQTCITAGITVTFANGVTYTISSGTMTNTGTAASKILFTSDHATIKAILTLTGVIEANVYLSGTRMDSSLGATVWTVGGVLTTTLNWNLLTAPGTVASGFVS